MFRAGDVQVEISFFPYFLYINLKNTSVTKYRIAQLLNIFNDEWEKKLKEIKYAKKKLP